MSTFHSLKIKNIIKETKDAVSLVFDIPENLQNEFSFIAGQYITLKTNINGEEIRRAYSLCSSPKSNEIKVTIKAVENGKFSVYATSKLAHGDILEVSKPEGKFTITPTAHKNYIGFAAGSGITPIMSMIKAVLESNSSATFTLIYGNKTFEETIFGKELNDLAAKYPTSFKLHYILSKENTDDAILSGRVNADKATHFIKNIYTNISFDMAYLCGPEEMISNVTEGLIKNGFSEDQISYELFTASIDEDAASQIKEGETEITVLLDDEKNTFTMNQKDDILAASLRNKLDAPYSCQGGVCSSCLAIVTEGKAVMVKNPILTDDELEEGYILTCQAHPVTPKITIDFDEV